MKTPLLVVLVGLTLGAGVSCQRRVAPAATAGDVRLSIEAATAVRESGRVRIACQAVLCNWTESNLVVKSRYSSAFDGLSVAVKAADGRMLGTTSILAGREPGWTELMPYPLPVGFTTQALEFVSDAVPADATGVVIQVFGNLPGSAYHAELRSNSLTVEVARAAP